MAVVPHVCNDVWVHSQFHSISRLNQSVGVRAMPPVVLRSRGTPVIPANVRWFVVDEVLARTPFGDEYVHFNSSSAAPISGPQMARLGLAHTQSAGPESDLWSSGSKKIEKDAVPVDAWSFACPRDVCMGSQPYRLGNAVPGTSWIGSSKSFAELHKPNLAQGGYAQSNFQWSIACSLTRKQRDRTSTELALQDICSVGEDHMTKTDIIEVTVRDMSGNWGNPAPEKKEPDANDECDEYYAIIIQTLRERLPDEELRTCTDFRHLSVDCCRICHLSMLITRCTSKNCRTARRPGSVARCAGRCGAKHLLTMMRISICSRRLAAEQGNHSGYTFLVRQTERTI